LLFLQNLTGFVVGKEFEQAGIIKKGSQMINAVTNSTVPHITVIVGNSYGAGTYAMSGRAYNNRFTFIWPSAKIAVMGGKQIAGVMSIVRRGQAARKGEDFDEETDAKLVAAVEAMQDKGSVAPARSRAPTVMEYSDCEFHDTTRCKPRRNCAACFSRRARDGDPLRCGLRRR
jgi:acetyl-CoA carboxylase carboxyltransferase component